MTARAAVLAVALASVAVAVALPFKIWLAQRGDIASLSAQTKQAQAEVDRLAAQQQRWKDPAYIEQQAGERLHYVRPGQKAYVVLGTPRTAHTSKQHAEDPSTLPWYSQVWQSVQTAGAK